MAMTFVKLVVILTLVFLPEGVKLFEDECGLQGVVCNEDERYRSITGACNNLKHPNWGTVHSTYDRLLFPKYGYNDTFALAVSGKQLPPSRILTLKIFTDDTLQDKHVSSGVAAYGQFLVHDMSFAFLENFLKCCTPDLQHINHYIPKCSGIDIPYSDPYYSLVYITCIPFIRATTNKDLKCSRYLGYTEQITATNSYIDLSVIYGDTDEIGNTMRTFKDGLLVEDNRKGYEWLPHSEGNAFCPGTYAKDRCYYAGDSRVDQNPQLTILHIIWAREHNRLARKLKKINPHWNDEKLFHEARKIAIAEHQFISYYELLPIYLGKESMIKDRILYETDGFVNDYDEDMRPNVYNEFAQGAFRYFHSMVVGNLDLINEHGCPYRDINLRDTLGAPNFIEEEENFNGLIRGLTTQPSTAPGKAVVPELTRFLFLIKYKYGFDLKSIDIQRARDCGIASYNDMRHFCGLKKAKHFNDFLDVMNQERVKLLQTNYEHPDDVDLIVGASLERIEKETLSGPTILCIMNEQFYKTRKSDRFWFENFHNGFTHEQLKEIRKISFSKLLCNNGNYITHMQKHGFLQVTSRNPRVSCKKISEPDLKHWKENVYDSYWQ